MKKWNLIIDVAKCENCNNCMLTTRDEHVGNDFPGYAAPQPVHGHNWIKIHRKVRGQDGMVDAAYRPTTCNHCDNAPCIKAAGDGSVYKRADGIVIIDPQKARGRMDIVSSCPYNAIFWNEELQLPQKWIFDAHLLDQGWKQPRCQQSCPTGVYWAVQVEDAEMQDLVKKHKLEVLRPELNTKPRVYYKNLYRFSKCFIGGSVVAEIDGILDCIPGARMMLKRAGQEIASAQSDTFGDFKFDGLDPDSGDYQVEAVHPDLGSAKAAVTLVDSRYLGLLRLQQSESSTRAAG
ncbi:4Fe-4S dicluster domain-containing protein [Pollutimonas bauzanensis]|uniref:Fe-S-cluster-containing dehydrogenase component n=1 Tax=Pollutimonas bauzanensis TaxID=658167 RepID=A0A1M5QFY2_9BURK|nr:4Fe-4S dicluster domain-containing protein [Pollutimonas bauzanensis]SHH13105.1 Fe-S-cluster-containing dehydrogenase component [Pollutimonas bauzanensis]